jgi:hypothetical protein
VAQILRKVAQKHRKISEKVLPKTVIKIVDFNGNDGRKKRLIYDSFLVAFPVRKSTFFTGGSTFFVKGGTFSTK